MIAPRRRIFDEINMYDENEEVRHIPPQSWHKKWGLIVLLLLIFVWAIGMGIQTQNRLDKKYFKKRNRNKNN